MRISDWSSDVCSSDLGVEQVDPAYFRTERRWQQLQGALEEDATGQAHAEPEVAKHFGTVGTLALDGEGHLAAGTSTGGMTDKRYGRIGDSPIIGAGTYANARCAVSGKIGRAHVGTPANNAHHVCRHQHEQ